MEAARNLISLAKALKMVHDDTKKKPHELLLNWGEIENTAEGKTVDMLVSVYRQIYMFIQLLQFYTKKDHVPLKPAAKDVT
jgi:hypothetical protein